MISKKVHELRRGSDTAKGTAAAQLADKVRYRLGLTATPVCNYAGEVHSIVDILAPGALGTREEFVRWWGSTWSPQVHEQGIGRLRLDGIGELPVAYLLVSEEGSDPAIAEVLQVKRQQGEQLVSPDGRLFENATADVNRTRLVAEAAVARASAR